MSMFYGPVLSRRFGYSLGIDIIPYKICSYDCIYCQLGKTTKKTIERKSYVRIDPEEFKRELSDILKNNKRIDYITFSGSGEPTLNKDIGFLIREVKNITDIPVAVLTNGSLLYKEDVINDLEGADLAKISLDAPDQKHFIKVNRPHRDIKFALLSEGLNSVLNNLSCRVWLEIMIMQGLNDSLETACQFRSFLKNLKITGTGHGIEKIHLNTPVRPTGKEKVLVPDHKRLLEIKNILGSRTELIKDQVIDIADKKYKSLDDGIFELARRRPVTSRDISRSLEVNINQILKHLQKLTDDKKIKSRIHNNKRFYYI